MFAAELRFKSALCISYEIGKHVIHGCGNQVDVAINHCKINGKHIRLQRKQNRDQYGFCQSVGKISL